MKRILLDATGCQNIQDGVGRYSYRIIENMLQQDSGGYRFRVLVPRWLDERHPLRRLVAGKLGWEIDTVQAGVIGPGRDARFLLPIGRYDLLHVLNNNLPLPLPRGVRRGSRVVVTVHDIIYYHYPEFFGKLHSYKSMYYRAIMRHVARKADAIISVSHATAADFNKHFGHYRPDSLPMEVIPNGVDRLNVPLAQLKKQLKTDAVRSYTGTASAPYLLYVGAQRPHKNIDRMIHAFTEFRALRTNNEKAHLIIAGSQHSTYTLPAPLPENVHYIGRIDDGLLHNLYVNAFALCYVSLYEGFGLPILEAMLHNTPVITSDRSATAEVAGDGAVLVNPESTGEIASAMDLLYNSANERARYAKLGQGRLQEYTWKRAARQTLELYRRLLGG